MLALLALGKLDKTRAFPQNDISPELLESVFISTSGVYGDATHYLELIPYLESNGRFDLVRIIKYKLPQYCGLSIMEKIRRYGYKYLKNKIRRMMNLPL
jgi:hypothetical protein